MNIFKSGREYYDLGLLVILFPCSVTVMANRSREFDFRNEIYSYFDVDDDIVEDTSKIVLRSKLVSKNSSAQRFSQS